MVLPMLRFGGRATEVLLDPLDKISVPIAHKAAQAGVTRAGSTDAVPFERSHREAEKPCHIVLVEQAVHIAPCYEETAQYKPGSILL
jgi:hypothetical protein